jgi:hypothetical protein
MGHSTRNGNMQNQQKNDNKLVLKKKQDKNINNTLVHKYI